jgi:hypothetical protein
MLQIALLSVTMVLAIPAHAYDCDAVQAFVAARSADELAAIGRARGGTCHECTSTRVCLRSAQDRAKIDCSVVCAKHAVLRRTRKPVHAAPTLPAGRPTETPTAAPAPPSTAEQALEPAATPPEPVREPEAGGWSR